MGPQVCKPCLAPLLIQVYTVKIPVCPQKTVLIRNCLCHIEISHTIGLCQLLQHLVIHCNPLIVYIGAFFFLPGADRQNGLENDLRLRMIGLQPFYQLCTLIAEGIGPVPAQLIDAQILPHAVFSNASSNGIRPKGVDTDLLNTDSTVAPVA